MQLSDIDPSFRPENAPPNLALTSFHWALKYRYYYLAASLTSPILVALISRLKFYKKYHLSGHVPFIFMIVYAHLTQTSVSLFSLGLNNSFDPLQSLFVPDARHALRALMQKTPGIYENDIYKFITNSPSYADLNLKIETGVELIDNESPYTALKLATEIGAQNVVALFQMIEDEKNVILLLLQSLNSKSKNNDLSKLNSDVIANVLSFFVGSKISELESKAPPSQLHAVKLFVESYAEQQRRKLPQILTNFKAKQRQSKLSEAQETEKYYFRPQINI
jgi:hypothetical protein